MYIKKIFKISFISLCTLTLISCGGGSSTGNKGDSRQTYKITLKNLTSNQNFSPLAVIVKKSSSSYKSFALGSTASTSLEYLAEGGDNSKLINEAKTNSALYANSFEEIKAGKTLEFSFSISKNENAKLELLSMLTKTNDAFVALAEYEISSLSSKKEFYLNAYDAGTEDNDELSSTIPALGGTGFNAVRNDSSNMVSLHQGVLSKAELSTSNLSVSDKWDNPVAFISIEKI